MGATGVPLPRAINTDLSFSQQRSNPWQRNGHPAWHSSAGRAVHRIAAGLTLLSSAGFAWPPRPNADVVVG
jgi:hypothetical protein